VIRLKTYEDKVLVKNVLVDFLSMI